MRRFVMASIIVASLASQAVTGTAFALGEVSGAFTGGAAAKADGADAAVYLENDGFKPGVYVFSKDTKVYKDISGKPMKNGPTLKKGTRINIYSAGSSNYSSRKNEWFNISVGAACNPGVVPTGLVEFVGVKAGNLKRIADTGPCK